MSPTVQQSNSPTVQQSNSPTAQQPNSPAVQQSSSLNVAELTPELLFETSPETFLFIGIQEGTLEEDAARIPNFKERVLAALTNEGIDPKDFIECQAQKANSIGCPHLWVSFYKGIRFLAEKLDIQNWEDSLDPERQHTTNFGRFFSEPIKVVELGPGTVSGDYKGCVVILAPRTNLGECDFTNSVIKSPWNETLNLRNCTLKNTTLVPGTGIGNIIFPDNPGSFGIVPPEYIKGPDYPKDLIPLLEIKNDPTIDLRSAWQRGVNLSTYNSTEQGRTPTIDEAELAKILEKIKTNKWRLTPDQKFQLGLEGGSERVPRTWKFPMKDIQLFDAVASLIQLGQNYDGKNTTLRIRWHLDTPAHDHQFVFERFKGDTLIVYCHDLETFFGREDRNVCLFSPRDDDGSCRAYTINERSVDAFGAKGEREYYRGLSWWDIKEQLNQIFLDPTESVDISWCSHPTKRPNWTKPIRFAELLQQMKDFDTLDSLPEDDQIAKLADFSKSLHETFKIIHGPNGKLTASKLPTS